MTDTSFPAFLRAIYEWLKGLPRVPVLFIVAYIMITGLAIGISFFFGLLYVPAILIFGWRLWAEDNRD